ncbi:MAG: SMP-30/gluconolactonase/LRE family protein [Acidobacteriia bacterium]|nr:SMP-30/gluconolactonase/LRE family protein [Terriglobia bacterium]
MKHKGKEIKNYRVLADGLRGLEGPVALADGSVLVCEMAEGRVTRVMPDGSKVVAAVTGGTPDGLALGPDGKCYVCNRGSSRWRQIGDLLLPVQEDEPNDPEARGYIQRFDLDTGKVEMLYEAAGELGLTGPNDLVFDAQGGFWFTDFGRMRPRNVDRGSVFYAKADGSLIREVMGPFMGPNGIGLSPDGNWLYVAESFTHHLYKFEIAGPGEIKRSPSPFPEHGGYFVGGPDGMAFFDSLALDSAGYVVVATPGAGILTVFHPRNGAYQKIPMPDMAPTNLCFGGKNLKTAYVTLLATGRLAAFDWPRPGLRLNYQ